MSSTTDNDVARRFRAALDDELAHTTARIAGLEHLIGDFVEATRDGLRDEESDDDTGALAMERSQTEGLLESAREHLEEIRSAFARLDAGTYGTCERCGRPISDARLEARPVARLCIDCASHHR